MWGALLTGSKQAMAGSVPKRRTLRLVMAFALTFGAVSSVACGGDDDTEQDGGGNGGGNGGDNGDGY